MRYLTTSMASLLASSLASNFVGVKNPGPLKIKNNNILIGINLGNSLLDSEIKLRTSGSHNCGDLLEVKGEGREFSEAFF